jgi:hypothetical protein
VRLTLIGEHVARFDASGNAVTKAHYVESEIEDRAVTRCGRQLRRVTPAGVLESVVTVAKCRQCK